MSKTKSNRSLDGFLKEGKTSSCCTKCNMTWSNISLDDFTKHVNKCCGKLNAVPIPKAGTGHPLIIVKEKKDKKKEKAKEERLKNSIANDEKRARAEKKTRARAAAHAAAEAKGKTDVKEKEGKKKGKTIKGVTEEHNEPVDSQEELQTCS